MQLGSCVSTTGCRTVWPLSVDEVARFWSSFRTSRDLAIVGLVLLQGLRSKEVLSLNRDDLLLSESDTPRRAGGLMSWAASKAVGPRV